VKFEVAADHAVVAMIEDALLLVEPSLASPAALPCRLEGLLLDLLSGALETACDGENEAQSRASKNKR
jgi:hypothetical protein